MAAVSMDIQKAYDSVPHNALVSHLLQLGIPPPLVRLLKDYLRDRKQVVQVDAAQSQSQIVRSGVTQGSVIGPFLFAAYVDSLLRLPLSKDSVAIMFVDDLILLKPIPTKDSEQQLQEVLDIIQTAYSTLF